MNFRHLGFYEEFIKTFIQTFDNVKSEALKRDGFKILRYYMTAFYLEVLAPLDDPKVKEEVLFNTLFMSEITTSISN